MANLRDLTPIAIALTVAAIAIAIGSDVVVNLRDSYTDGTKPYEAANFSLDGMLELGSWFPTIGLTIAAGLVIGVVVASFVLSKD